MKARHVLTLISIIITFCSIKVHSQIKSARGNAQVTEKIDSPIKYFTNLLETRKLFDEGKFEMVIPRGKSLIDYFSGDGYNYYMVGQSYFRLNNFNEAIEYFKQSMNLGFYHEPNATIKIAKCYSLMGQKKTALDWLGRGLALGYSNKFGIEGDDSFSNIKNEKAFKDLVIPEPRTSRNEGWINDIDYLLSEIKRLHYVYRRSTLPDSILSQTSKLKDGIEKLTDAQVVVELQHLLAALGDGHSLLFPVGMRIGELKLVPIKFYFFSDGLFIIDSDSSNRDLIGAKVTRIGEYEPNSLLRKLKRYISRDNPMGEKWVGPSYMILTDFLLAVKAIKSDTEVPITVVTKMNTEVKRKILIKTRSIEESDLVYKLFPSKLTTSIKPPLFLSQVEDNYWFTGIDEKTLYFQFNQIANKDGETLDAFTQRLEKKLVDPQIKNLILDVRLNNGGESTMLFGLYRALIRFESDERRVFLITGRNTFSACQDFISNCDKLLKNPVFIGEPSSSRPNSYGDESLFLLPYSGVMGSISVGYHMNGQISRDDRQWIAPQMPIELSSKDYFQNVDPVLNSLIDYFKAK